MSDYISLCSSSLFLSALLQQVVYGHRCDHGWVIFLPGHFGRSPVSSPNAALTCPLIGNPRITHGNRACSQPGSPTQLLPGSGKGNGHLATPRCSSYGRCLTIPCRGTTRYPPLNPSRLSQSRSGRIEKCGLLRPPMKTKGSPAPRQWPSRWQHRQRWRDGKR